MIIPQNASCSPEERCGKLAIGPAGDFDAGAVQSIAGDSVPMSNVFRRHQVSKKENTISI